jgi:type 1 fimbria pilin
MNLYLEVRRWGKIPGLRAIAAFARKIFLPAALAWVPLAGMQSAHAAVCNFSAVNPLRAVFSQVNISPNADVGATLATVVLNFPVSCPASSRGFYLLYEIYAPLAASKTVAGAWELPQPIRGIGVRVTNITHSMVLGGASCSTVGNTACQFAPSNLTVTPNPSSLSITFQVELVKTGAITMGDPGLGPIVSFRTYDLTGTTPSNIMGNIYFGNSSIVASTCTVPAPNISVALPTLNVSQINPTGGDTAFQVGLQCSAAKPVKVTMTDATTPSNTTDLLTLASGSTASGVKLRILSGGAAIPFNPNSTAPGLSVGASTVGAFNIPLTVQYVRDGTPAPGTVKAVATFTLSYQ